jgi:hypothetical protein
MSPLNTVAGSQINPNGVIVLERNRDQAIGEDWGWSERGNLKEVSFTRTINGAHDNKYWRWDPRWTLERRFCVVFLTPLYNPFQPKFAIRNR